MKDYKRVSLSKVKFMQRYLHRKLGKEKKVLIIAEIERVSGFVNAIYSFANAKVEDTWYRCYWTKEDGPLENHVLTQTLYPCYKYGWNGQLVYTCNYEDSQNITSFYDAAERVSLYKDSRQDDVEDIEGFESNKFYYEVYLSKNECDIGNFGSQLELDFLYDFAIYKKLTEHKIEYLENINTVITFERDLGCLLFRS